MNKKVINFIIKHGKTIDIILVICLIISVLSIPIVKIGLDSYSSYSDYGNYSKFDDSIKKGNINGYYSSNGTIVLIKNSTITLRHELCHREQFKNKNYKYTYWSEVECNIRELFFWKKVNLTTKDYG